MPAVFGIPTMSVGAATVQPVSPQRTPSLAPILAEVRWEREAQLRHLDALDAKAGLVLGFASALAALASGETLLVQVGRLVAVMGGLLGVWTFWPRNWPGMDLRNLRDLYLGAERSFTELSVLDTQIEMADRAASHMRNKALRLKGAMTALAVAAIFMAIGLAVD